ncbi:MAG: hypothetical protein EHM28_11315 [Spirochaetaceae bacterium]|nr:MAG: hypothetical protein EHM28_11315 [Spirochaetaceae bacterium]
MRAIDHKDIEKLREALAGISACFGELRGILPLSMIPENSAYESIRDIIDEKVFGYRRALAGQGAYADAGSCHMSGKQQGLWIQFADLSLPEARFFETANREEYTAWIAAFEQGMTINLEIISVLENLFGEPDSEIMDDSGIAAARRRFAVMAQSALYPAWVRKWYGYCVMLLDARLCPITKSCPCG